MKKVFIVDHIGWMGHHAMYNKVLAEIFSKEYHVCHVGSNPQALERFLNEKAINNFNAYSLHLNFIYSAIFKILNWVYKGESIRLWVYLNLKLRQHGLKKQDLVFLVSGDSFLNSNIQIPKSWIFSKWMALCMFTKPDQFNDVVGKAVKVFHLNKDTVDNLNHPRVCLFPDFTVIEHNKIKSPFPNRNFVVGLCGGLSKRKGFLRLVRLSSRYPEYNFLFAGRLIDHSYSAAELNEIGSFIKNPPTNVKMMLGEISDQDFNGYVHLSDIIYCAYEDFDHSSNLLTKAAYFKKPVLAKKGAYIGRMVDEYHLGVTIPNLKDESIIKGIKTIEAGGFKDSCFQKFYEENSIDKLNQVLLEDAGHEY